jgi:hypothetical protein
MEEEDRTNIQLGLGMGLFDTTVGFDDDQDVDIKMTAVSLAGTWLFGERWSARAGFGVLTDGTLETRDGTTHDVDSGGLVSVGAEYRANVGQGSTPTLDISMALGWSWAKTLAPGSTAKTDYSAADVRFGARAGWLVGSNFYPYAAARLFGGPVNWQLDGEDVTGSDKHHYQVALGAAVTSGVVGVFAEWAGLGERGLSAGLSAAW